MSMSQLCGLLYGEGATLTSSAPRATLFFVTCQTHIQTLLRCLFLTHIYSNTHAYITHTYTHIHTYTHAHPPSRRLRLCSPAPSLSSPASKSRTATRVLVCKVSILICNVSFLICNVSFLICNLRVLVCKVSVLICNVSILKCKVSVLICNVWVLVCNVWVVCGVSKVKTAHRVEEENPDVYPIFFGTDLSCKILKVG